MEFKQYDTLRIDPKDLENHTLKHLSTLIKQHPISQERSWFEAFIAYLADKPLKEVCEIASDNLIQSMAEGKRNDMALFSSDLIMQVTTFPSDIEMARKEHFSQGYISFLAFCLDHFYKKNPSAHFTHFLYFYNGVQCWTLFTLFPNKNNLDYKPMIVLPLQLLSLDEREEYKL